MQIILQYYLFVIYFVRTDNSAQLRLNEERPKMRTVNANDLIIPISQKIKYALTHVDERVLNNLKTAHINESSPLCRWALGQIIENDEIAAKENAYACQDCGQAMLFVSLGQDLHVSGSLTDALNKAVETGYEDARKSVADPLTRLNTKTNTPAIIHYDVVEGDALTVSFMAKGAGSENMCKTYMLTPSKGVRGIVDSVVDCVSKAGSSPCPPVILGVGVGGTMDLCALLSKKALVTEYISEREDILELRNKILEDVNALGIGAQGFGGSITALDAFVMTAPTHIGMMPVAVTIQCHSDLQFTLEF